MAHGVRKKGSPMKQSALGIGLLAAMSLAAHAGPQESYPIGVLGGRVQPTERSDGTGLKVVWLAKGFPGATGGLRVGDEIIAVNSKKFLKGYMAPLKVLGNTLDATLGESKPERRMLKLIVLRGGEKKDLGIRLSSKFRGLAKTFPVGCPKALSMYEQACLNMAGVYASGRSLRGGDVTNMLGVMALLGHREGKYDKVVRNHILGRAAAFKEEAGGGSVWLLSYTGIMLCEYYSLYPHEKEVEQAILNIAKRLAKHMPDHGRYGHHLRLENKNAVAYDGKGLNATTSAAVWFMATAARLGIEPESYREAFVKALARLHKETNANGGVGYSWPSDHQSSMRSGHTGLAMIHITRGGLFDRTTSGSKNAAVPQGLVNFDPLGYGKRVGTWPMRHSEDLLEAHAVSSMGLTSSTASLAAWDHAQFVLLMQKWRWWFTLSHELRPMQNKKTRGLDHTFGYVGGPNNTGGDFYLNGHKPLHDPTLMNTIQHATVGFILASTQGRLSFHGGLPEIRHFPIKQVVANPTLAKVYTMVRHARSDQGEQALTQAMVLLQPILDRKTRTRFPAEVLDLAKKLDAYAESKTVLLDFEQLVELCKGKDKYMANEAYRTFVKKYGRLKRYQPKLLPLQKSLQAPESRRAITQGREFYRLKKLVERAPKTSRPSLERYIQSGPTNFYLEKAQELLKSINAETGVEAKEGAVSMQARSSGRMSLA